MDPITALLYSYVRVAKSYAETPDMGSKKTLGQFRTRLLRHGIRVISFAPLPEKNRIAVQITVDGEPKTVEIPDPARGAD